MNIKYISNSHLKLMIFQSQIVFEMLKYWNTENTQIL